MQYIAAVESSGGKFRDHPYVNSGVQQGTHAISSYGIMPTTAYEMVQRNKPFQATPVGQQLLNTQGDPNEINRVTADTHNDSDIMGALIDDSSKRLAPYITRDDSPEAALLYAHRRGVPAAVQSLQEGKMGYMDDPYVKPYLDQYPPSSDDDDDKKAQLDALSNLIGDE